MDNDFSQKLNAILGDPAMMSKIKTIAGSLGASSSPPPPPPREEHKEDKIADCSSCSRTMPCGAQALCPISSERSALSKSIADSRALLIALKPYLDSERCQRIDKILGMMKIAEIMGYLK